jgi:hypothetical protein
MTAMTDSMIGFFRNVFHLLSISAASSHQKSDLVLRRFAVIERAFDLPVVNDRDGVGKIHDFIELIGNEQDCDALVALRNQRPVHVLNGADVQSACRLDRDQDLRVIGNLAPDDDFLLVAAGESRGLFSARSLPGGYRIL